MFALRRTTIAEGVKFVGSVTAKGLVQIGGQIEGDLQCAILIITRRAHIIGTIEARHLVVDGKVEGPINGGNVVLKSKAHVVGNIRCQTLIVDKGARVEGRLDFAADKCEPQEIKTFNRDLVRQQEEKKLVAAAEASTRLAELVTEARHQAGNPNFATTEALAFLIERGNDEAKVFLSALRSS